MPQVVIFHARSDDLLAASSSRLARLGPPQLGFPLSSADGVGILLLITRYHADAGALEWLSANGTIEVFESGDERLHH